MTCTVQQRRRATKIAAQLEHTGCIADVEAVGPATGIHDEWTLCILVEAHGVPASVHAALAGFGLRSLPPTQRRASGLVEMTAAIED